jgi:hypothetical protein
VTKRSDLCDVAYGVENSGVTLRVKNRRKSKLTRVIYAAKCQVQNREGKGESFETFPVEGLSMTVKRQDEIEKRIRTLGIAVKGLTLSVTVAKADYPMTP